MGSVKKTAPVVNATRATGSKMPHSETAPSSGLTPLTLCADDYGLAPGLSRVIRDLIAQGRLHATSCMTISPHWGEMAPLLKPLAAQADVGLHLTLTDQIPLGPMPSFAPKGRFPALGSVLKASVSGRLPIDDIRAELERQFDAFLAHFGQTPAYLDGHHHVHQLPQVGRVVIDLWRRRMGGKGWIRSCYDSPLAIMSRGISPVRALVISELGRGFRRQLIRQGIPHNSTFRGVYDFSGKVPFSRLFRRFTVHPGPRALMMVHPGQVDDALRAQDHLTSQREVEWHFLESDDCPRALAENGLELSRLFP